MPNLPKGDRIIKFLYDNAIFIVILFIGFQVWALVFNIAVQDYLDTSFWRTRHAWLGNDPIDLFGMSISVNFEGYSDYSFYYVHWGNNILRGVMPYDPDFGYIILDGYTNENGAYMFPPLYAYLYAAGISLTPELYWGIGLLITAFGFLTVFPVYGVARELSNNRHVGEVAALTYLLNPLSLYYSAFVWLNPAPFIFFFFSGFYMLIKGRKHTGTILIVCSALFKQTAWFLGIPLVVYILIRQRERKPEPKDVANPSSPTEKEPALQFLMNYFDIKGFLVSTILVVAFVLAVFLPHIIATPWFMRNLSLAAGGFSLESFTELPGYGSPIRFQVLPVAAGLPELAQFLDFIIFYGFLLTFGVMVLFGLMLLEDRYSGESRQYLRRLLFFTLVLMLWVHLMGPRGVYKYYFVLFAPFFSIFSSAKMVESKEDTVKFSTSMIYLPFLLSLAIVLPAREIYLFSVLLIFLAYLLTEQIGAFWVVVTTPIRWFKKKIKYVLNPLLDRLDGVRQRRGAFQTKTIHIGNSTYTVRFIGAMDQIFKRNKVLLSQVIHNDELISERSIPIWNEDSEDLSKASHTFSVNEGGQKIDYEIHHESTVFLSIKMVRNGVVI